MPRHLRLAAPVLAAVVTLSAACGGGTPPAPAQAPQLPSVAELSIPDMQQALADGRLTSRQLVTAYLVRIGLYEDRLNAAVMVNPHALEEADRLDRERAAGQVRGPLHGIPVALKDNIHTTDMPTTGGALALAGWTPPYDATLTENLRASGAIIIAKAGLTELANWVAGAPDPMPGNFNSLTGFGYNPYDPRPDPREVPGDGRPVLSTGGSSSGIGTAASLWAANVGTDTGGSVISPSNANMLVGIRPTIGRISRHGVIPVTSDHDTAGPMARTVADAAIMLGAMEGAAPDPDDPATQTCEPPSNRDYTAFLDPKALEGARIGIPRAYYYDPVTVGGRQMGGLAPEQRQAMDEAIAALRAAGAVIVDPADVPSYATTDPAQNFAAWNFCAGDDGAKGKDADCSVNFKYGMKRDFNKWLDSLGDSKPYASLTAFRQWNLAHAKGALRYGQSRFDISDEMDLVADRARFEADHAKDLRLSREEGIDGVIDAHDLDAILTPGGAGAGLAARAGYPIIVVPFARVPNTPSRPLPEGFDPQPAPFGVGFTGKQCTEPRLIAIAYAFEQATKKRVPPPLFP
ncbi:MAG: amidase family protein [Vicinamibacterales bacterium]